MGSIDVSLAAADGVLVRRWVRSSAREECGGLILLHSGGGRIISKPRS